MREEALLTEHRELVETYNSYYVNIFYYWVSLLILEGASASVLGVLWSVKQPLIVKSSLTFVGLALSILAPILFVFHVSRIRAILITLTNRAIAIESSLRKRGVPLATFERTIVSIEKGRFLADSKGTYKTLKPWQKLNIFNIIYLVSLLIVLVWILGCTILLLFGG